MLDWMLGAGMAIALSAVAFAISGSVGTAVLIAIIALIAAFAGWQWLIHSDHLGLQMP